MLLVHGRVERRPVDLARREEDEALDRGLADRVEEDLRALDVRRHELGRAGLDRLLDVRLGCGVHDHVHLGDDLADEVGVADVAVDERVPLVPGRIGEVVHAPRVGERVEGDDLVRGRLEDVAHEVRRDEPRAAGDENALRLHGPEAYPCRLGSPAVTKFVVLSTQRSGSTWVVDMLNSHPRVLAQSELFMHGGEGHPQWGGDRDLLYWQTFIADKGGGRLVRPYWLWHYLGRAFAARPGIDAVGFKLMYSQLTRISKPLMPALWLKRARIIHLMRRNALDVVLSKEAGARRAACSMHATGKTVEAVRLRLDPDDLLGG